MTFAASARTSVRETPVAKTGVARLVLDLVRYGLVSLVALAIDYGLLLLLVHLNLYYLAASTISFTVGMAVAYALSVRFVFAERRAVSREVEAAGFFAVGVVGLLLTQALLYTMVAHLGMSVAVAKIPTTGFVFLFNFICRRGMVFTGSRRSRHVRFCGLAPTEKAEQGQCVKDRDAIPHRRPTLS